MERGPEGAEEGEGKRGDAAAVAGLGAPAAVPEVGGDEVALNLTARKKIMEITENIKTSKGPENFEDEKKWQLPDDGIIWWKA